MMLLVQQEGGGLREALCKGLQCEACVCEVTHSLCRCKGQR